MKKKMEIWNQDLFKTKEMYLFNYRDFMFRKVNDYLRQKTYRSPGSPTRKGYTVVASIRKIDQFEPLFNSLNLEINYQVSFRENYKKHINILRKESIKVLEKELGVKFIF